MDGDSADVTKCFTARYYNRLADKTRGSKRQYDMYKAPFNVGDIRGGSDVAPRSQLEKSRPVGKMVPRRSVLESGRLSYVPVSFLFSRHLSQWGPFSFFE